MLFCSSEICWFTVLIYDKLAWTSTEKKIHFYVESWNFCSLKYVYFAWTSEGISFVPAQFCYQPMTSTEVIHRQLKPGTLPAAAAQLAYELKNSLNFAEISQSPQAFNFAWAFQRCSSAVIRECPEGVLPQPSSSSLVSKTSPLNF